MSEQITYLIFVFYLLAILGIGFHFYDRKARPEVFLLGSRAMNSWVTALSAQAGDMSGWLLVVLPGAIYLFGISQIWIAGGILAGSMLNWLLVAPRLRVYSARLGALTVAGFISLRFRDPLHLLRIFSALLIVVFFTVYAAGALAGAGKLFESVFQINYGYAVAIGMAAIVTYTVAGGFPAVCWTDLFQGLLLFSALVILPLAMIIRLDPESIVQAAEAKNISMSLLPAPAGVSVGAEWYNTPAMLAAWALAASLTLGLGYFGQPHILTRFMAVGSVRLLPQATVIAVSWVACTLLGAIIIGLAAIPIFDHLPPGDHEKAFVFLIQRFFSPYLGGILLAAILAAVITVIDSQLLAAGSTLTEDCYRHFIRASAGERERVLSCRIFIVLIALASGVLALAREHSVFSLVIFAWSGFGATFGPAVLTGLFSKRTTWGAVLAGMAAGVLTLLAWRGFGLHLYLYEIVPGFAANILVIAVVNCFLPQRDPAVLAEYKQMKHELHELLRRS